MMINILHTNLALALKNQGKWVMAQQPSAATGAFDPVSEAGMFTLVPDGACSKYSELNTQLNMGRSL